MRVSFGPYLMLAKQLSGVAYFLAPWYWRKNNLESCVQEVTVSGSIYLNHFLAITANVTTKHLHRARHKT